MLSATLHHCKRSLVLIAAFACLLILPLFRIVYAQTEVAGEVSGVWNTEGSPYIVIDNIDVPVGEELLIDPGVEVRFGGRFQFRVRGTLVAEGTEQDSIFFVSNRLGEVEPWWSIRFLDADDASILAYLHIEGSATHGGGWVRICGGGVYIESCSPTVRNCTITGCNGRGGGIGIRFNSEPMIVENLIEDNIGGGIYCDNRGTYDPNDTSPVIIRNVIRNNGQGSGIALRYAGFVTIRDNIIVENGFCGITADRTNLVIVADNDVSGNLSAGGIAISWSRAMIKDNLIDGNRSAEGGGVHLLGARAICTGNVIVNNSAEAWGGGVYVRPGAQNVHIHNNVIFGNSAGESGGGVTVRDTLNTNVQNCIIWGNEAPEGEQIGEFTGEIGYCVVEDGFDGQEIIEDNPQFVDPGQRDFRLQDDSPCIDAGNPYPPYNDADGSRADIGIQGGNPLLFGFATQFDLGQVGVNCRTGDLFTFANTGQDAVEISEGRLEDDENFYAGLEFPVVIEPFEWIDIPIVFRPTEAGEFETGLSFILDDYDPFDETVLVLTGEGVDGYFGEPSGVWSIDDSPIHVIGRVTVPEGDTLFVEPGVEVRFDPETRLMVNGTLIAVGTDEDSIRFTSALDEPEPGSWRGLFVNGLMDYCVVEFAQTGIWLREGRVVHSTIRRCTFTGVYIQAHRGVVSHCVIENIHAEEELLGRAVYFAPFGTLEFSRIINCDFGLYTDDNGYAYRNVFANNEYLMMSGWDSGILAEGNIFYHCALGVSPFGLGGPSLSSNCLYETEQLNYEFVEDLNFRNQNGTPCDRYFNIIQDPMFVDPDNFDFRLQEDSPCINAGNLDWQRDPDGSWADIGAFYFDHDGGDPLLEVDPVSIEAEGSSEHVINLGNDGDGRLWWRTLIDAEWITCDPQHGNLRPGGDMDIFVELNDENFDPGMYEAVLVIDSNDPENPNFEINISMRVIEDNIRAINVSLAEGWNLISVNIDPLNCYAEDEDRGPDILRMFMPYADEIILLKDEQGRFYAPEFDNFINIPFWNLTEGYLIKVRRDIEMVWSGEIIPADADVPIEEGWNMIAYFPHYELDASAPDFYVLSPIIDNVLIAKDGDGNFMLPEHDFSNMPPWRETQGYQIKVDEDVVLNYPEELENVAFAFNTPPHNPPLLRSGGGSARYFPGSEENFHSRRARFPGGESKGGASRPHWTFPKPTGRNMSVLITNIQNPKSKIQNSQIAAFNSDGLLVGVGWAGGVARKVAGGDAYATGLAVWGDDPSTEEVDGLQEGEAFELRLGNDPLQVTRIHAGSGLIYATDEFTVLEAAAVPPLPADFSLSEAFPNPFNSVTKISYGLPEASPTTIRVYDISGRLVATLVDGETTAGRHTVTWEAASIATGVYLVRMEAYDFSAVRKVIIAR